MKIGWLSDIHLNFLKDIEVSAFIDKLVSADVDLWVISGDIGEANCVLDYLNCLTSGLERPVYFVLGNHDYYGSSIKKVTQRVMAATREGKLEGLNTSGPIELDGGIALVGDDGWGDARFGDPLRSQVELSDFFMIKELSRLSRTKLIARTRALGDECAARLAPKLAEAADGNAKVCIVTHVPPFEGAAWYAGKQSGPEWLPWFSCASTGRVISECAERHPDVDFLVLCGHTHGAGYFEALKNVTVYTAGAKYESPEIQGIVTEESGRLRVQLIRQQVL